VQTTLFDPAEPLRRAQPLCPACGAVGLTPCGHFRGSDCYEPGTRIPLHREGQPWVHGCRPAPSTLDLAAL